MKRWVTLRALLAGVSIALLAPSMVSCGLENPRQGVLEALAEYEAAYEARDLERLEQVWRMSEDERAVVEGQFARDEELALEIARTSIDIDGNTALVGFDQTLRIGEAPATSAPFEVELSRGPLGRWRIAALQSRTSDASPLRKAPAARVSASPRSGPPSDEQVPPKVAAGPGGSVPKRSALKSPAPPKSKAGTRAESPLVAAGLFGTAESGLARRSLAQLRAELIRRSGGEWVIVHLTPQEGAQQGRSPAAAGASQSASPGGGDQAGIRAALAEYEYALERGDLERLGRVWVMNPFERARLERLYENGARVAVSIDYGEITTAGDQATARFAQRFVVGGRSQIARAFRAKSRRGLAAQDAYGNWGLDGS